MDLPLSVFICLFTRLFLYVESVPPAICFENFKWGDCGLPPVAVIYYYKSGSRCEVALWRGCLPNPNMFKDEYSCVNTCIFTVRAHPEDYHKINYEDYEYAVFSASNETSSEEPESASEAGEESDTTGSAAEGGGDTTGAAGGGGSDGAATGASGGGGGEGAETTAAPAPAK